MAQRVADWLGQEATYDQLRQGLEWALHRPQDWGGSRGWMNRPNGDWDTLREEVCRILWRLPNHPSRIPRTHRGLPFKTLTRIARAGVKILWYDAPNGRVREEWLAAVAVNRRYGGSEWQEWLEQPLRWVIRHLPWAAGYTPRSWGIAQWILRKRDWVGWQRELPGAGGLTPAEMLDEVWDEDLSQGEKTSPARVFQTVLQRRLEKLAREGYDAKARTPLLPWTLEVPGIRHLRGEREFILEGKRMNHCVGGYWEAALRGRCFILALPRSTAEIRPNGSVYQHRGYGNAEPPEHDKALLRQWLGTRREVKGRNEGENPPDMAADALVG